MTTITYRNAAGKYNSFAIATRSRRVARVAAKKFKGWAYMKGYLVTRKVWMDETKSLPRMVLGRGVPEEC